MSKQGWYLGILFGASLISVGTMSGTSTPSEVDREITTKTFANFLGKPAAALLKASPFELWPSEKSVDEDLPERTINYVFSKQGLSITCDGEDDEKIQTIFLHPRELVDFDVELIDVPVSSTRREVLDRLGTPSKSGSPRKSEILGEYGAWDRYDWPDYSLHVQYRTDADQIEMITLMRHDVVP